MVPSSSRLKIANNNAISAPKVRTCGTTISYLESIGSEPDA